MQLTWPSRVTAITLIIASRLVFASPVARNLVGRQDTNTGELETTTGSGLECKH